MHDYAVNLMKFKLLQIIRGGKKWCGVLLLQGVCAHVVMLFINIWVVWSNGMFFERTNPTRLACKLHEEVSVPVLGNGFYRENFVRMQSMLWRGNSDCRLGANGNHTSRIHLVEV